MNSLVGDVFGAFLQRADELLEQGKLDAVLRDTSRLVGHFAWAPQFLNRVVSSPELDKLCQRIGAFTWPGVSAKGRIGADIDTIVYVATQLHQYGGHSRLLEDFIRLQASRRHHLLITNVSNLDPAQILPRFILDAANEVEVAPTGSFLDKLIWLQERLVAISPATTILMNHWHDVVAIAAPRPGTGNFAFVHHVDHTLCLGVHIDYFRHIDLFPMRFYDCRQKLAITNNIYWPCSVPDLGPRSPDSICPPGKTLTTCTSGTPYKFAGPYPYSYFQEVPNIIERTGGTHVHVGPLAEQILDMIRDELQCRGIDPSRFIHIPWVRSLWNTLGEYSVDAYISSFPICGGRALLEVLGSGTPALAHRQLFEAYLSDFHLMYPGALLWSRPDELYHRLQKLTPEEMREHAQMGRRWYETHFRPELLQICLARFPGDGGITPPEPGNTYIDPLAASLSPGGLSAVVGKRLGLAQLLDDTGLSASAEACRGEVAQLDVIVAEGLFATGRRRFVQGDWEAAAKLLRRSVAISPDSPAGQNSLGCALFRLGEIDLAISHFRRALELKPDFSEAQANLQVAVNSANAKHGN